MNSKINKYTNSFFIIVLSAIILSGCVSNQKITYLQYEDELAKPKEIVTDSILRIYEAGELRYRLQANDILNIKIASMTPEEYNPFAIADRYISAGGVGGANVGSNTSTGYRIDPFGYLDLPVIGQLKAAGLTIDMLEDTINMRAKSQLEDPVTKINLMNFRFTVMGEVNGEGLLQSDDNSLTLMQALAMAGGADEFGDLSRVKVIRRIGDENFVYYTNLLDESFLSSEFYFVYPNDMIIVPPLKSRVMLRYTATNISIIASTLSLAASIFALFAISGGN